MMAMHRFEDAVRSRFNGAPEQQTAWFDCQSGEPRLNALLRRWYAGDVGQRVVAVIGPKRRRQRGPTSGH